MKVFITADLHYNVKRSHDPARRLIAQINASGADAVILVGDTADFTYVVTNTGDLDLAAIEVVDDHLGGVLPAEANRGPASRPNPDPEHDHQDRQGYRPGH